MARGVVGTIIGIMLLLTALGGIYYLYNFMFGKSQGTTGNNNNFTGVAPEPNSMVGGRRKKRGNKKSTTMTTTGIYLLLGAVIVGYITSKFA